MKSIPGDACGCLSSQQTSGVFCLRPPLDCLHQIPELGGAAMRLQPTYIDVRQLRHQLDAGDLNAVEEAVLPLHPAELADVLLQLDAGELAALQSRLSATRMADALAEMDPSEAARLVARFSRAIASGILQQMDP